MSATQAVESLIQERQRRGWSVRRCATEAGISNTHWGEIEKGIVPITDRVRVAIAKAFGWPTDWPDNPPPPPAMAERDDQVLAAIAALVDRVDTLTVEVRELRKRAR